MADVTIRMRPNGPFLVEGPFKLLDSQGREFKLDPAKPAYALCRCGQRVALGVALVGFVFTRLVFGAWPLTFEIPVLNRFNFEGGDQQGLSSGSDSDAAWRSAPARPR